MSDPASQPPTTGEKTVDRKLRDRVHRGSTAPTPIGRLTFIGLRLLDVPLQYTLLKRAFPALLPKWGGTPIAASKTLLLGLSPHQLLLLSMATFVSLKQSHWSAAISGESMPVRDALTVAVFIGGWNTVNSLLFTWNATSAAASPYVISIPFTDNIQLPVSSVVGAALFGLGLTLEWVSEIQRRNFKKQAKNKGKSFSGGLFSLARHINYGGYMLWRAGYALASSGVIASGLTAAFFASEFLRRGIPVLDEYCQNRYGEQWSAYKRQVTWKLLPGIV